MTASNTTHIHRKVCGKCMILTSKLALLSVGLTVNHALCETVIQSGFGSLKCFVIINCTKFGLFILRKIIKIVAT